MPMEPDPPVPTGAGAPSTTSPEARAEAAARLATHWGATDVLVFRRVRRGTWAHVGGVGRGQSWAGIVETDQGDEPLLRQALASPHPVRLLGGPLSRVIGPYYASTAALVRVRSDILLVWGHPDRSPALMSAADDDLAAASHELHALDDGTSPAQRLSDELEVLHAVQQVTSVLDQPLRQALERVASTAAEALSCELAAVWLPSGRYAVAQRGWALACSPRRLAELLPDLAVPLGSGRVVQDARSLPLPAPVGPDDGIVSYLLLPLGSGDGLLLAAHTETAPRGFTQLCQRVAGQIAAAAGVALQAAAAREQLEDQLFDSRTRVEQDALTGVASRHAWDEALRRAQRVVDGATPVTLALVDLDELKKVNDTRGHAAGDALLKTCAQALRRCVREDRDVVARFGGDEFAMLVGGSDDAAGFAERVRAELDAARTVDGHPVRASIGVVACPAGGQISVAFERADAAMYADKRARRG